MGEGYKPGPAERDEAESHLSGDDLDQSLKRARGLEIQSTEIGMIGDTLAEDFEKALDEFDVKLHAAEKSSKDAGMYSPEVIRDAREAKRIESDIRRSLEELKKLKFGARS